MANLYCQNRPHYLHIFVTHTDLGDHFRSRGISEFMHSGTVEVKLSFKGIRTGLRRRWSLFLLA